MNHIGQITFSIQHIIQSLFSVSLEQINGLEITLNTDQRVAFGDLSCNAGLLLAKLLGKNPRECALLLKEALEQKKHHEPLSIIAQTIAQIEIAGPGFLNMWITPPTWHAVAWGLWVEKKSYFRGEPRHRKKYLIEFVSANPTGPLHLGHGRNGIIGDVLARVLTLLGHEVYKEFYINDAGNQIKKLGASLKVRCEHICGLPTEFPEDGYHGEYLITIAHACIKEYGKEVLTKDNHFFATFATKHLLEIIRQTLIKYGITYDGWFSERKLHLSGAIEEVLEEFKQKNLVYEKDGALWFRADLFGDEKDRVIKKSDGEYTYIAADIAYHKNKFERGFDYLINVLGQDHHGYVKRLQGTMASLGYPAHNLHVILYQLVSITNQGAAVRMSKRKGTFTDLSDIIDEVGTDVARFFYLNRKADAHLDFDLAVALKHSDENPVYYIHYAYVRIKSILHKAHEHPQFAQFIQAMHKNDRETFAAFIRYLDQPEYKVLKKIVSFETVLKIVARAYHVHLVSYFALELAQHFHAYYGVHKIIDVTQEEVSCARLVLLLLLQDALGLCLDLLGLSKPEKM
jgi:arginyl-tRNA synthetase